MLAAETTALTQLISPNALAYLGGGLAIGIGALGGALHWQHLFQSHRIGRSSTRSPAAGPALDVHRLCVGRSAVLYALVIAILLLFVVK